MTPVLVRKENNEAAFTMAFTAQDFEEALQKAYKTQRNKFTVDGFRKGKAPRKIIEAKYGEDIFFEDALDELFRQGYPEAVDTLGLKPVDRPSLDFGEEKLEKGKDFTVTVTVTVAPEVVVKDYKGVQVEKVLKQINEEDVDKELETFRNRNARLVAVDRKAQDGDTVSLDYSGLWAKSSLKAAQQKIRPKCLSGTHSRFEEQLRRSGAGDQTDVRVTFGGCHVGRAFFVPESAASEREPRWTMSLPRT